MNERRRRAAPGRNPDQEAAPRTRAPLSLLLLGLLAGAIALLPPIRAALTDADNPADGYSEIVAGAIASNWLYVVPSDGETGDVDGRVERAGGAPPAFDRFIQASFLREDMATLDPAIWRYDGSSLGIDPNAHLVGGAYDGVGGWRGSLLFADTRVEQQLLDDRGTTAAWLVDGKGARAVNLNRPARNPQAEAGEAPAEANEAVELRFEAAIDGTSIEVARIRRIGGHALLRILRRDRDLVKVRVGGLDAMPRGAFQVAWRVLESGDTLTFELPGGLRRYQYVQTESAISRGRGDAPRVREASLASMATSVEAAMGSGAQSLRTTIDSRVHGVAQQALVELAMDLYEQDRSITSFRAAAVLMDGKTGEIAALPTFPAAPEHLHPSQRGSPTHRKMLDRNSNFVRMVAGSTAKAPLAMAIVNRMPALTGFRIGPSDPFRILFGLDLGVPVPDKGGPTWDFTSFLARSSNKYAAALMMLGLSTPDQLDDCAGPGNEPWELGALRRDCRPVMPFLERTRRGPYGLIGSWSAEAPAWGNDLYSLFCINPNSPDDAAPVPSTACLAEDSRRRPIWRGASFARPRLLAAASPEREGFGLRIVDKLYEDYVMTILGGNRGRWTTIGLAQAYSRILTGRGVVARLTQPGGSGDEEQPETVALPINREAQQAVLNGLKGVVAQGGTGQQLGGVNLGPEFRLFAKTGTPNVSFLGEDDRAILQEFAAAGCGLRLVERPARAGAPARAELVVGDNPDLPIDRAIAAQPNCVTRFGPQAGRLVQLIGQLNRSPSLSGVRADSQGRVTRIPGDIQLRDGTGHLLVVMVARYPANARDTDAPCSVRTIAINFQARAPSLTNPATRYALSLLANPITRQWFVGTPCGQGQAQ